MFVRSINSSFYKLLQLVVVFTISVAVFLHLTEEPSGSSHDFEPVSVGLSEVEAILDRYDHVGPRALSIGTPADAALAVCIAIKDSHKDLREVRRPAPTATAPSPGLARARPFLTLEGAPSSFPRVTQSSVRVAD